MMAYFIGFLWKISQYCPFAHMRILDSRAHHLTLEHQYKSWTRGKPLRGKNVSWRFYLNSSVMSLCHCSPYSLWSLNVGEWVCLHSLLGNAAVFQALDSDFGKQSRIRFEQGLIGKAPENNRDVCYSRTPLPPQKKHLEEFSGNPFPKFG